MASPLAGPAAADLDRFIRTHFEWLEELVKGLSVVGELSDRSKDAIASVGERLSSLVVSFAFRAAGMPTQHVDSRRVIVTDDRFTQATVLFDETYDQSRREELRPIAEHSVVVMGGFHRFHQERRHHHPWPRRFRLLCRHRRRGR